MQATTTRSLPNNRAAATAILAAGIFAAGVILGGVAGTTLSPKAAPVAAIQASEPDVTGLRLQRQGEIGVVPVLSRSDALRWHRNGEINAASEPEVESTSTAPRYEVVPGK